MWYDDGLHFECTECGKCCGGGPGYVWVNQETIERLAKRMGLSPFLFEQAFVFTVAGNKKSLKDHENGDCIFLDETTRRCRVYEDRPIQCRTWPFWTHNLTSPKAWDHAAKKCAGCNQGRLYSLEEIEERRDDTELLER